MATLTPNLGLTKPQPGGDDDLWAPMINGDLDILDAQVVTQALADLRYLKLAGGTMQGPLLLQHDAIQPLEPVTKQQLDALGGGTTISTTPPLNPKPGVTWWDPTSGNLFVWYDDNSSKQWVPATATAGGGGGAFLQTTGGTMTGPLTLAGNAASALQAVPLQQLTSSISSALGGYLPISGGTLTPPANITMDAGVLNAGVVIARKSAGNAFVGSHHQSASSNFGIWNFNDVLYFGHADGAGNVINAQANLDAAGRFTANSDVIVGGLTRFNYASVGDFYMHRANGARYLNFADQWWLSFAESGGLLAWNTPNGSVFNININGDVFSKTFTGQYIHSTGAVLADAGIIGHGIASVGGAFYVDSIYNSTYVARNPNNGTWTFVENGTWNCNIDTGGGVTARGGMTAPWIHSTGNLAADNAVTSRGGSMVLGWGGSGGIMQFQDQWYWDWNGGTGELAWQTPNGRLINLRTSDNLTWNQIGAMGGHGYWDLSDERSKTDIAPHRGGLDAVMALRPIRFRRQSRNEIIAGRDEIGFSAQQTKGIIPEAVAAIDNLGDDSPTLAINATAILANVVNAIQSINARLEALEGNA